LLRSRDAEHYVRPPQCFACAAMHPTVGVIVAGPGFVLGSVFSGAAWFGTFELAWSAAKAVMPIPEKVDSSAQVTGLVTLPITAGGTIWLGWLVCPPMAPLPDSVIDISGLLTYARSVPLKHMAVVGGSSAVMAALTCRVVQHRGGA
jgi:hypothetical protein